MKTEIEVKFLSVDHDAVRANLRSLGAVCTKSMRLMRRAIIDYPDRRLESGTVNSFIRVRDEGGKVTLTYKQFQSQSVSGAKELEVEVSSFADTTAIFTAVGLCVISLQESKRETWAYKDCEIVLDEWPWLRPYLEIEGTHEGQVQKVAIDLGFTWEDGVFGDVMVAYRKQYPHLTHRQTISSLPEVLFTMPVPDFLQI